MLPFLLATTRFEELSTLSEYARWAVMMVACYFAWQHDFRRGRGLRMNGFDLAAIGFLAICAASYFWSINPTYSVMRAGSMLLLYVASFWAMWRYMDIYSEDWFWRVLLRALGGVMAVNLLLGSVLLPGELIGGRFRGFFENPNNIGLVAGVSLPLVFLYWLRKREKLDFVIAVVIGLNVVAAGSRTAILAAGLAGLGIVICLMRKRPKLAMAMVVPVLAATVYFIQTDYFTENVLRESSLDNASNRVVFWEFARTFIERRPALGHGFGVDAMVWQHYGLDKQSLQLRGYGVMSSYYGMAVVMGKPVAYVFFTSFWLWVLYGLYKHRANILMVGYLLTIAAGLVICIFETALYSAGNSFAYLFWIVVMLYLRRDVYKRNGIKLNKRGGLQRKAKKARRARMRERKPTETVEAAAAS